MKNLIFTKIMILFMFSSCNTAENKSKERDTTANVYETRIGTLNFTHDFENGYPTDKTVDLLFNEMDFQRACQAYI